MRRGIVPQCVQYFRNRIFRELLDVRFSIYPQIYCNLSVICGAFAPPPGGGYLRCQLFHLQLTT